MKIIIAGKRDFNKDNMLNLIKWFFVGPGRDFKPSEVVSGGALGVDSAGETYAFLNSIHIKNFDADWDKRGKAAGPIRNKQMAEYADALLLIWNGESPGSKSMKSEMTKLGKPIYEIILKG